MINWILVNELKKFLNIRGKMEQIVRKKSRRMDEFINSSKQIMRTLQFETKPRLVILKITEKAMILICSSYTKVVVPYN